MFFSEPHMENQFHLSQIAKKILVTTGILMPEMLSLSYKDDHFRFSPPFWRLKNNAKIVQPKVQGEKQFSPGDLVIHALFLIFLNMDTSMSDTLIKTCI